MPYDRLLAVQYAAFWWNGFNPAFRRFFDDCTNFISQSLYAGGMPMEAAGRRDAGWWYLHADEGWSFSWTVAHSLRWYLETSGRGRRVEQASALQLGDVITYDWNGDGVWQHNTIVVGYDPAGEPLVAAHTVPSWGRPWRYTDSPAFTERTRYLFFQIEVP
jgi:hypothetical protein